MWAQQSGGVRRIDGRGRAVTAGRLGRVGGLVALLLAGGCGGGGGGGGGVPDAGPADAGGGRGHLTGTLSPVAPSTASATPGGASGPPAALVEAVRSHFAAAPGPSVRRLPAGQAPAPLGDADFVPGVVLVRLRGGDASALAHLASIPGLGGYRFEPDVWAGPDVLTVRVTDAAQPGRALGPAETRTVTARLAASGRLASAEPNLRHALRRVPDDPLFELQWHYRQIGLPAAWDVTTGSSDVVVAVIDDGVNAHPDLSDRLLGGYDMVSDTKYSGDGDGRDPDPSQVTGADGGRSLWHGTHVAGTIGAITNNGYAVSGVDWACRLLPIRVIGVSASDGSQGTSVDVIAGMNWAVGIDVPGVPPNDHPADVLNLSLGGGPTIQAEQDAIDAAVARGAVVVVAAGNDDADAAGTSFGGYDHVLVVGAAGFQGARASYSDFGDTVDLMAPGGAYETDANADGYPDAVLSTWLGDDGVSPEAFFLAGTSMAAPHVSGIAALMKGLDPTLTPAALEQVLKQTADPAGQCAEGCGAGLVNAAAAVRAVAAGGPGGPAVPALSADRVSVGGASTARLFLYDAGGAPLDWSAEVVDQPALTLAGPASGRLEAGASTSLDLAIDRTALADGTYQGTLVVTGAGGAGEARASIVFTVGATKSTDVGDLVVATVALDANQDLLEGGRTTTTAADGYAFDLESEAGDWYVVAVGDRDGNGEIDLLGFWRTLDSVETITVPDGGTVPGVDFVVAPYEYGHGTVPCGALRTCIEHCAGDAACIAACPVSDGCQSCLDGEITPCTDASGCAADDLACACAACPDPFAQCYGPLYCETRTGG